MPNSLPDPAFKEHVQKTPHLDAVPSKVTQHSVDGGDLEIQIGSASPHPAEWIPVDINDFGTRNPNK